MSLALVFPGQGAQYVGMAGTLAAEVPAAAALLQRADAVLGFSLSAIMANGPEADLTRTDRSQLAILVHSLMALEALGAGGVAIDAACTAGLSLGEYTALVAAGALEFEDALKLVQIRGQAMQAAAEAVPGGMVALIGPDEAGAQRLCDAAAQGEVLAVANLNSPGQVVISGAKSACDRAVALAKEHGIRRALPLPVAGAFHSPLMAPAAERLGQALAATRFRAPRIPVYSNVTALPVTDPGAIPDLLTRQLTNPVRWEQSVRALHAAGVDTAWEFGPGKTLSGMIARIAPAVTCRNLDQAADRSAWA